MSHDHISFEDVRRFARFVIGLVPSEDPNWVVEYAASVRFCEDCAVRAHRANALMLGDKCGGRTNPADVREDCLSIDDMMDLEEDMDEAVHLSQCTACQLRYYEALALSAIGAEECEDGGTEGSEPARVYSLARPATDARLTTPILAAGYRIAASFGALVLGQDLLSGLLGPEEGEPVAEAVVREGHALKDVRIELDYEAKTLVVAALPPSYPAQRLRLRVEDELLEPETLVASKARFDLSGVWHDGDHNFELVLVEP